MTKLYEVEEDNDEAALLRMTFFPSTLPSQRGMEPVRTQATSIEENTDQPVWSSAQTLMRTSTGVTGRESERSVAKESNFIRRGLRRERGVYCTVRESHDR